MQWLVFCTFLYLFWASQVALGVKNPPTNVGDMRDMASTRKSGRSLEKEMATHFSILGWRMPMDGGAWWATVYGVAKSQTRLKRHSTACTKLLTALGRAVRESWVSGFLAHVPGPPDPGGPGQASRCPQKLMCCLLTPIYTRES